jgi:hypothetical protein
MNKRLEKRHKRQVSRAKVHVRLSVPDLRTPEEVRLAREASRPTDGRTKGPQPHLRNSMPVRNRAISPSGSAAKADV